MAPTVESVGGSLLVPSVQEMVKQPVTTVPERYRRLDQVPPASYHHKSLAMSMIPTIDMQKLLVEESSEAGHDDGLELCRLHSACKDWGFFQVS